MFKPDAQYLIVIVSIISAMTSLQARASADWHEPSNYPATVTSVDFPGYSINQTTSGQWGSWSVGFGSTPPKASAQDAYGYFSVDIRDLVCTNSVAGSAGCLMRLTHSDKYNEDRCNIFPDQSDLKIFAGFAIACPADLGLAP